MWLPALLIEACLFGQLDRGSNEELGHESFAPPGPSRKHCFAMRTPLRAARKFPSSQIHLSLSLPASLTSSSGPSLDPYASKILLVMEKKLGSWLQEVLAEEM